MDGAALASAFAQSFTVQVVIMLLVGVLIGNLFAVLPGLEAQNSMVLALPLIVFWDPVLGLALLIGMFKGGAFGGSLPAILLGTPTSAEAAAALLDGRPMALKGQAGKAMRMALHASVAGDLLSTLALIGGTALLAPFALRIGPPEYFAIVLLAVTAIGFVSSGSMWRTLGSASLGFLIASVGLDPMGAVPRYQFGQLELSSGVGLLPFIVGLMALSTVFVELARPDPVGAQVRQDHTVTTDSDRLTLREYVSCIPTIIRASILGSLFGLTPGLGQAPAAFSSWALNRRMSKNGSKYGTGHLEGVAATDAASNSAVGPSLVPLLSLGIPGTGTAAVFAIALLAYGISPGPLIFERQADMVATIYLLFLIGVPCGLVGGYIVRAQAHRIMYLPKEYLYPAILVLALLAMYSLNRNVFDVLTAIAGGVLGYVLVRANYPLVPLLIAFILGHLLETNLRRTVLLFRGDFGALFLRPIVMVCLVTTVCLVFFSVVPIGRHASSVKKWIRRKLARV